MTLAEVARILRLPSYPDGRAKSDYEAGVLSAIRAFESDNDFTLRERIEARAKKWETTLPDWHFAGARGLRDLLEGKP